MNRKNVEQGGEFHPTGRSIRIFEERTFSLYTFIVESLHLPFLQSLINLLDSFIKKIDEEANYMMPEIVSFRWIADYIINFTINPNSHIYLPRAVAAARDMQEREAWNYFVSEWREHERRPHTPKLSFSENPSPRITQYPEPIKGYTILAELKQLKHALEKDLQETFFFQLNSEEEKFFNLVSGEAIDALVFQKFPTLENDVRAAGRCYATATKSDYTACVFHLGRATEIVTQELAFRFNINPDWPDAANPNHKPGKKCWGDFIGSLEAIVGATITTTQIHDATIRAELSHALAASRSLKKTRNLTDHVYLSLSEFYDKEAAEKIWMETKAFIEHAAKTF